MSLDTTKLNEVVNYLKTAENLIENEKQKETLSKVIASADNALEAMADNEEKYAYLYYILISWAQQASIFLLQADRFDDELVAAYRSFPLPDEAYNAYKEFDTARKEEIARINDEQKEVMDKQRGFEIFQAIVNGMSKEEAKQKMEEYEKQIAAAQAQTRR